MANIFETETCSRCGGSGEYSYCQMHGSTCFKCHGKRVTMTKRGTAAMAWLRSQREIKAADVKVGMFVYIRGVGKFTVTEAYLEATPSCKSLQPDGTWKEYSHFIIRGEASWAGIHTFPDHTVELLGSKADQAALIAAAIEYQNNLTKAGKPRKQAA